MVGFAELVVAVGVLVVIVLAGVRIFRNPGHGGVWDQSAGGWDGGCDGGSGADC